MMYHPIKCGWWNINSSADIVETVIFDQMSSYCDPELEDSKPIFLHDTFAHDVASPYRVWLQKVQQLKRYHSDEHLLEFWTFPVTLTKTEQCNLFTRQSSLWWCAIKPSLVAKGSAVQIIHIKKTFLIILFLTVTLTLNTANQSFLKDNLAYNDASPYQVW